jgi:hypothetical protein
MQGHNRLPRLASSWSSSCALGQIPWTRMPVRVPPVHQVNQYRRYLWWLPEPDAVPIMSLGCSCKYVGQSNNRCVSIASLQLLDALPRLSNQTPISAAQPRLDMLASNDLRHPQQTRGPGPFPSKLLAHLGDLADKR